MRIRGSCPSGTITWIINAIETAPADKRVILVTHCPVSEQYLDDLQDYYLTPKTTFTSILADHSNIIAVFSGHRHHFFQDTETIKVVDFHQPLRSADQRWLLWR